MGFPLQRGSRAVALIGSAILALTACTNASEAGARTSSFDPTALAEDESLASQVPAAIKSKGTLVVGSDTSFAPSEFLGGPDNQTPMGYDVDLAKAIAATLGLRANVETAGFASILPALGPKYDLGISNFVVTSERLKAVNMVTYGTASSAWAVQKGNPKNFSVDGVCGTKVGVQTGSIQADDVAALNDKCIQSGKQPIEVIALDKQTDVNTRLVNGAIDAMDSASDVVGYAIQQAQGAIEKLGDTYDSAPQGIAIAKDDPALADLIQKVMAKLMADGTYKKILDTWNVSDIGVAKSELNPQLAS
ncbi:ABC transporter substrate-binding protein [Sinomonas sp.]|uniref:ABC transporter substrate-binding protein n=1 Tax=Sinomonas sp. TaxID=1914986 RepID=UPI002C341185|nr:ABC transporter substrate-binding protein [Sinomonas sp.]